MNNTVVRYGFSCQSSGDDQTVSVLVFYPKTAARHVATTRLYSPAAVTLLHSFPPIWVYIAVHYNADYYDSYLSIVATVANYLVSA